MDEEVQLLLGQLDKWLTTWRDENGESRQSSLCLAFWWLITCVCLAACRSLVMTARAILARVPELEKAVEKDFWVLEVLRMLKKALEKSVSATSGTQLQLLLF